MKTGFVFMLKRVEMLYMNVTNLNSQSATHKSVTFLIFETVSAVVHFLMEIPAQIFLKNKFYKALKIPKRLIGLKGQPSMTKEWLMILFNVNFKIKSLSILNQNAPNHS